MFIPTLAILALILLANLQQTYPASLHDGAHDLHEGGLVRARIDVVRPDRTDSATQTTNI